MRHAPPQPHPDDVACPLAPFIITQAFYEHSTKLPGPNVALASLPPTPLSRSLSFLFPAFLQFLLLVLLISYFLSSLGLQGSPCQTSLLQCTLLTLPLLLLPPNGTHSISRAICACAQSSTFGAPPISDKMKRNVNFADPLIPCNQIGWLMKEYVAYIVSGDIKDNFHQL